MEKAKNNPWQIAVIGLKLLLICAIVAGVVALVYTVTADAYAKNMEAEKRTAIEGIFHAGVNPVDVQGEVGSEFPVYRVEENGAVLGYCVEITTAGYGGDIQMMVGYNRDGSILGIQIVSHSETPGLGDKITGDAFRSQYVGQSGQLALGDHIDAISGATYSSRYVTEGVNKASAVVAKCIAKEATE
ncbi:MAG: RnfABCDGE type electron transport complex subunit G [Clostridia bacterium]|nr:RnfABCDGE type electron transport complex subunit G [Clostridia bacterium]